MKTKKIGTLLAGLISVAIIAVGVNAFAGKGMGYRDGDQRYHGYGHQRGAGGCGYANADLTPEQREQMDAERKAFFESTSEARQDLRVKQLELRTELAKRSPDAEKAAALQKEISALRSDLDQKRLSHIMTMRKINPHAGMGYCAGNPGMGRAMGHGMGGGPGHGNCWR